MQEREAVRPGCIAVIKETLRMNRKLRVYLVLLVGLWIVTGTRMITEKIVYRRHNLKEAK